jgi:hypothetical protein
VTNLKRILDDFTAATGLAINFHKSTSVPIKMSSAEAAQAAENFGCAVSSFPQTYLGLPLSTHKLRLANFAPIILKSDMRLSGWRGRSLSIGGRLLLVNSVLTSMLAHAMNAGLLPAGVIEAIDKRRRAFLWTGEETCNGGQCKVAWTDVCAPKKQGGLGVISLPAQNSALLGKFLSKLHSASDAPWVAWFRRSYGWTDNHDMGDRHSLDTSIWKDILAGLSTFRLISKVSVGDGNSTSFWLDLWLGPAPFHERYPALFSHSIRPNASVFHVLHTGLNSNLGPRLSHAATGDLLALTCELGSVVLRPDIPDARVGRLTNKGLTNKDFYTNSFRHLQVDDQATMVWRTAAPLKCKVFCWLARRRRLPTNERRFRYTVAPSAACPSCPADEDTDHLLIRCPRAQDVWSFFHPDATHLSNASLTDVLQLLFRSFEEATVNTAILWNIWKRRNALVFNNVDESLPLVVKNCVQDVRLWAYRCPKENSRCILNSWCITYDPP